MNTFKKHAILWIAVLLVAGLSGCGDNNPLPDEELQQFMYITLAGANVNPNTVSVPLGTYEDTTVVITAAYGGTTNFNQGDLSLKLEVVAALVESFNDANGTAYRLYPEGGYTMSADRLEFVNGYNLSTVVRLKFDGNKVDMGADYILPLTVTEVSGGSMKMNDKLKTLYFIPVARTDEENLRDGWSINAVTTAENGHEAVAAIDEDAATWWQSTAAGQLPQSFVVDMGGYKRVDGFVWQNVQDAGITALPLTVLFETSTDRSTWKTVAEVADMTEVAAAAGVDIRSLLTIPIEGHYAVARYFRVTVQSNTEGTGLACVADVNTYSGQAPSVQQIERDKWTIVSCNSIWAAGWEANNILDDNPLSTWHTAVGVTWPVECVIDFSKELLVSGILWADRIDDKNARAFPKNVTISVSNDQTTWTEVLKDPLWDITGCDLTKDGTYHWHDLPCTTPAKGRYMKVSIATNWDGSGYTYMGGISIY